MLHTYVMTESLTIFFNAVQNIIEIIYLINFCCKLDNKASVPELQKFVEISDIDGASNFAPKIITQKTYW